MVASVAQVPYVRLHLLDGAVLDLGIALLGGIQITERASLCQKKKHFYNFVLNVYINFKGFGLLVFRLFGCLVLIFLNY